MANPIITELSGEMKTLATNYKTVIASKQSIIAAANNNVATTTNKIKGNNPIKGSVGKAGQNAAADIVTIQELLTKRGYKTTVDGKASDTLNNTITKYQKEKMSVKSPDGRVDAGGNTWFHLLTGKAATNEQKVLAIVSQYDEPIKKAAAQYGMDALHLKAIMCVESKGQVNASSGAAHGLMQITIDTWNDTIRINKELAKYDFKTYHNNPEINILVGAAVLKDKAKAVNTKPTDTNFGTLAIIAYNAGQGTVLKAIEFATKAKSPQPKIDFIKPEFLKPAIDDRGIYSYYLTGKGKTRNTSGSKTEAINLKYQEIAQYGPKFESYLKTEKDLQNLYGANNTPAPNTPPNNNTTTPPANNSTTPTPAPKPAASISASVGQGGINNKQDVITIQNLLNTKGHKLVVDGSCGPKTIAAITAFQKDIVKLTKPDGRVDVNGKTWKALIASNTTAAQTPTTPTVVASTTLTASVGKDGVNKPEDVKLIKSLLNQKANANLSLSNTAIGDVTIAIITNYQKDVVKLKNPDGRIDVGGATWKALSGQNNTTVAPPNNSNGSVNNPSSTNNSTNIPNVTQIDKTKKWAQQKNAYTAAIIASPQEVQNVMNKIKAADSPAHWQSKPWQQATTFNQHDQYLKDKGAIGYIKGKAMIARPDNADLSSINKAYGTITSYNVSPNNPNRSKDEAAYKKAYITSFRTPYPLLYLGTQTANSVQLHKLVGQSFVAALEEILKFYGLDMIQKLGINLYDGTFNYRAKRNGGEPSLHAYGCAVDFAGKLNPLGTEWNNDASLFHQAPYSAFIDIMEKYGWHSQGRATGNDYMHFQTAAYK